MSARAAWAALWLADHAAGSEVVDRTLPRLRARVHARMAEAMASAEPGRLEAVPRRQDLDAATFIAEHVSRDVPVVLAGAARDWPAIRRWTLEAFAERHGDVEVQLINAELGADGGSRAGSQVRLAEALRQIAAGEPVYPRFLPLLDQDPELQADLDLDWLRRRRGPTGGHLALQLFIGGPGTSTALHSAVGSNLFVQVRGRKRWWLAAGRWAPALDVELARSPYFFTAADLEARDTERFPWLDRVQVLQADLDEGDVLFVPPLFWHQIRNPTHSIGVGVRFYDPRAMLRVSRTMTALTLLATQPPLWKAARLKGDFSRIFTGRW